MSAENLSPTILKGKIVLIAEDDPDLREILCSSFERYGAKVLPAENGKIATTLFEKNRIDFIVSDVRMPEADGMYFLSYVRTRDLKEPPFFFLTGYSDISIPDALEKGAQAIFKKPFRSKELVQNILTFLPRETADTGQN